MNIPIFFTFYLIGYLICAKCIHEGFKVYREIYAGKAGWELRKNWLWRAFNKHDRLMIAVVSLAWPYNLAMGLLTFFRQQKEEPFDLNRLRYCSDKLCWCDTKPIWWVSNCADDNYKIIPLPGGTVLIVETEFMDKHCMIGWMQHFNRCAEEYDPQMCECFQL